MVLATSRSLWLDWNLSPSLVLGLAALAGGYLYVLGPWGRRRGWTGKIDRTRAACFFAGVAVLALALMSPLDALGDDYLFSAHMVQHMLIAIVAPPLLLLGMPEGLFEPLRRWPRLLQALRWLGNPIVAFGLFNANLWLWHVPSLYDATLANENVHVFEHLTFIVTGVLFWLPIVGPARLVPRLARGADVLYLFLACQPMVALGALLTFAATPFYAPYVAAPRLWGTTPLGDQQLGGLIMWMPTNIPYLIGLSVLFFRWVGERDQAERAAFEQDDAPYELFPTAPRPAATRARGTEGAEPPGAS